jgi:hypothetical protein
MLISFLETEYPKLDVNQKSNLIQSFTNSLEDLKDKGIELQGIENVKPHLRWKEAMSQIKQIPLI